MSFLVDHAAILGLFLLLAYLACTGEPINEPAASVNSPDEEARKANVVLRCLEERGRIIREFRRAEGSSAPTDVAGMKAYFAIQDEWHERVKAGLYEADEWIVEQLQGRSLRELGTFDDGRWATRSQNEPSSDDERPFDPLDP